MTSALVISALCGLSGLTAGCHSRTTVNDETPPPQVNGDSVIIPTNSPQLATISVREAGTNAPAPIPLAGRLVWDEDATVRVFTPFAGIVRKIFPAANQQVNRGAPLAEIQSAEFGQAQAETRKAQSDFRRAQSSLTRLRDLFEHGAAPRKDLENAEADYASAEAEKERTEARLAIYAGSRLPSGQDFLLPSPLDGILVEKNVTPGQEVRPDQMLANLPQLGAPLFVISDPSHLWIQIEATEVDLPHLQPKRLFTFASRAFPGQTFTGRVDSISESIDPSTRTIKVRGSVDNSARRLKAEMFVSVTVPGEISANASVPAQAVFLAGDKHYLFIEQEPGHFMRREIQLGPEHNDLVEVASGLKPGERVVTQGCLLLQKALTTGAHLAASS
jgi:cobalt-zinc-cadmium efflux system membrane fusion protein